MKKAIVAMVVLGLLPITSAPANAGVTTCKNFMTKVSDKRLGWTYRNVYRCTSQ